MRPFVLPALVGAMLIGGCGHAEDVATPSPSPSLARPALELPTIEAATAGEADAAHSAALDALFVGPFRYRADVDAEAGRFDLAGSADPAAEVSRSTLRVQALQLIGIGDVTVETRFVGGRAYVKDPSISTAPCWLDYAKATGATPPSWVPFAVGAVDGTARGYVAGSDDTMIVDVDGYNLVAAAVGGLATQLYIEEPAPVPVIVTLRDGVVAEARYNLAEAVWALADAGATLSNSSELTIVDLAGLLDSEVTVYFSSDEPVEVRVPPVCDAA